MDINLTIGQVASHDFKKNLRILQKSIPNEQIFERLIIQRKETLTLATKFLVTTVFLCWWLSSSNSSITLPILLVKISIPVSYITIISIFCLGSSFLFFINYFVLTRLISIASIELFNTDSTATITIPYEGNNAWSLGFHRKSPFLLASNSYKLAQLILVTALNIPYIIIYASLLWVTIEYSLVAIKGSGALSVVGLFLLASWIWTSVIFLIGVAYLIPFKFSKNTRYIRWNFLYPLHKKNGSTPSKIDSWLQKRRTER